jgi:acetyl esterase/lipase
MRKVLFAFSIFLTIVLARPLSAQQNSSAPSKPASSPAHDNISYGVANGETLLLDILEPANTDSAGPRPAIILIHGGGWVSFDKATMRPLAEFLALAGFVAVPINYRLFHDASTRWPAQLDDVQRAVRWLRANASKYNVDPNHIGAYGHSSGAQLALLLGMLDTRDNSDPALAKYSSRVQAVVDSSGPVDFTVHQDDDAVKFFDEFLGGDYATHPEIWRAASPIFHVSKSNAPILIIHGTRDEMVPIAQAQALDDALKKAGADVKFLSLDSDHSFHDPAARRQLAVATQAFFDRYLVVPSRP